MKRQAPSAVPPSPPPHPTPHTFNRHRLRGVGTASDQPLLAFPAVTLHRSVVRGCPFTNVTVTKIATTHGVSAAQVLFSQPNESCRGQVAFSQPGNVLPHVTHNGFKHGATGLGLRSMDPAARCHRSTWDRCGREQGVRWRLHWLKAVTLLGDCNWCRVSVSPRHADGTAAVAGGSVHQGGPRCVELCADRAGHGGAQCDRGRAVETSPSASWLPSHPFPLTSPSQFPSHCAPPPHSSGLSVIAVRWPPKSEQFN